MRNLHRVECVGCSLGIEGLHLNVFEVDLENRVVGFFLIVKPIFQSVAGNILLWEEPV